MSLCLKTLKYLLKQHTEPHKICLAVFFGMVIGTTPFFGFHLLLCIIIAFLFKLNKVFVYLAANISNPFFIPFLSYGSIQIGHFINKGKFLDLTIKNITVLDNQFLQNWILGSLVLGTMLGLLLSSILRIFLRDKDRFSKAIYKLGDAFSKQGLMLGKNSIGKCKYDPIYKDLILNHLPKEIDILDIGGGQGFLPILHSIYHNQNRGHIIIDWDEKKINQGSIATKNLNFDFQYKNENVFNLDISKKSNCITIIDVLHYRPHKEQDKLLKKAINLLSPGGILILRDMDKGKLLKNWFTSVQEKLCLLVGRTKAKKIYPRKSEDFVKILSENNTTIRYKKAQGGLFSNVLFVCEKN